MDIRIPETALDRMISTYTAEIYKGNGTAAEYRAAMEKAAIALLEAWPGASEHTIQVPDDESDDIRYKLKKIGIILPFSGE